MNNKDLLYKKLNALRLEVHSSIVDDIVTTVDDLFSQPNGSKPHVSGALPLSDADIATEAEKRYPEQISVVGKDSDRKQRHNQRMFIEGAKWMQKAGRQ